MHDDNKKTNKPLGSLLEKARTIHFWEQCDDGFIAHKLSGKRKKIKTPQLEELDNRLASYLNKASRLRGAEKKIRGVDGAVVYKTLAIWFQACTVLRNVSGKSYAVFTLDDASVTGQTVTIKGGLHEVLNFDMILNGQRTIVERIREQTQSTLPLEVDWMEKHYPGWHARLAAYESLGATELDKVAYVLAKPQVSLSLVATLPSDMQA